MKRTIMENLCKNILFSAMIAILLIISTGGAAMAQTSADPDLSGYFVSISWQPSGPFDAADLRQLIGNGLLTRDSLVWKEGMANWAPAGTVAELAQLFPAAPPPVPGAPPPLAQAPPPQQAASATAQGEPWGGHPAVAGLANAFFGIWSFTNDDVTGGIYTAVLEAGGIVLSMIGSSLYRTWYWNGGNYGMAQAIYFAGYGVTIAGTVYGFYKGFTQYNGKMAAARSFAEAIGDNPLNNIRLVAFPVSSEGRVAGALTYSISY